jgi:oligopeptide transport system permease protein
MESRLAPAREGAGDDLPDAPTGLWREAWRRLLRNRVAVIAGLYILLITLAATFAPLVTPYERDAPDFDHTRAAPSFEHPFGTDPLGRDVLTRIIYGGRVSLGVAFVGALTSMAIGLTYGAVSGYLGGWVDDLMMRFVDVMYGFPMLLFIILTMLVIPPNSGTGLIMVGLFAAIGLVSWPGMARLVRGQFLSLREQDFVVAARALGAKPVRIITRYLIPNSLGPIIVALTLSIPSLILTESTLSFIGLGVKNPVPSWGGMLADGWRAMRADPHLAVFPALAITVTMLAFNFFGDGLRDALDPTLRGRG